MSTVSAQIKGIKRLCLQYGIQCDTLLPYMLYRCTVQVTLSKLCPFIMRFETILTFGGILQHGGVYILVYSIGKHRVRCAQPSRC